MLIQNSIQTQKTSIKRKWCPWGDYGGCDYCADSDNDDKDGVGT